MALLKRTVESISGVQVAIGLYHRARSVVGAVNDIQILHGIYRKFIVQNLVDNVISQTSCLTFFITEEKSKKFFFFILFRLKCKLNHIISRGIL